AKDIDPPLINRVEIRGAVNRRAHPRACAVGLYLEARRVLLERRLIGGVRKIVAELPARNGEVHFALRLPALYEHDRVKACERVTRRIALRGRLADQDAPQQ